MRAVSTIIALLLLVQFTLLGCALGKKEWPSAVKEEDTFGLELVIGDRQESCLLLELEVTGAAHRLFRASVQYEFIGDDGGCIGCPFVPRNAAHYTRNSNDFKINGNMLSLSLCGLDPDKEYRFRIAGKSELPNSPLVFTDVYVTTP